MTNDDIFVYFIPLPGKTKEAVTQNEDGTYTIFINENLCEEKKIAAYYHGVKHIKDLDFQRDDVQTIESLAHYRELATTTKGIRASKYEEKIQKLRIERNKTQWKLKKLEAKIEFMQIYSDLYVAAENNWLYRNDL